MLVVPPFPLSSLLFPSLSPPCFPPFPLLLSFLLSLSSILFSSPYSHSPIPFSFLLLYSLTIFFPFIYFPCVFLIPYYLLLFSFYYLFYYEITLIFTFPIFSSLFVPYFSLFLLLLLLHTTFIISATLHHK